MPKISYQNGFVLVVALIMLIAITGVAVALLVSSGVDNKMMSSAQESELAINEARGAHDEAYRSEEFQIGGQNQFGLDIPIGVEVPVRQGQPNSRGTISTYGLVATPTNCPHSLNPNSKAISCSFKRVITDTNFGEQNQTIRVQSVAVQRLISN